MHTRYTFDVQRRVGKRTACRAARSLARRLRWRSLIRCGGRGRDCVFCQEASCRLLEKPGLGFDSFVLLAASACAGQESPRPEPFDVLIRGGRIVDGTGNPWFEGDLAIRGARIAAVGPLAADIPARRVIDARGLVVAPGFIDIHSHSDLTLLEDGAAQSKVRQGVTTEILGEDTSAGPAKGKSRPPRIEGIKQSPTWSTLGGYFDALERQGIAVNVASYVGLGTLLNCVQGDALERPARAAARRNESLARRSPRRRCDRPLDHAGQPARARCHDSMTWSRSVRL